MLRHIYFLSLTVAMLMAVGFIPAPALSQTPSPDQLEMFQGMTPEQQQSILEAMTGSRTSRGGGSGIRPDRRLEFPETVLPRRQNYLDGEDREDDVPPALRRLNPGDTVLLTLEIRRLTRKPPEVEEQERRERQAAAMQSGMSGNQWPVVTERGGTSATETPQDVLERTVDEQRRLAAYRERVLRDNPYKLDSRGILNLPDMDPIPLAGLTAEDATQRLSSDLRFSDYIVVVTRLPLRPLGTESLKPFGYDLFSGAPTTFAPATDVPVPAEYVVGPGDVLQVQLIGNTRGRYELVVGRDGRINFPDLGPVVVSGQRFDDVRAQLESLVQDRLIGTEVNVGMGELRSIRVFVLGEAEVPGSYTVSGLSTITNALFVSGGVRKIGSLRNIQLRRQGKTVTTLDLYDLLLKGDTRADMRLLPGDVIFIPPIGTTIGLSGEVRRAAIYELKNETSVQQLLELGGGVLPEADIKMTTLERISAERQRITVNVDLSSEAGRAMALRSGDVLRIPGIRPTLEQSVTIKGHLHRPGEHQYIAGMKMTDVLPHLDELKPNADQRYVLIRRELPHNRQIQILSVDLERALSQPQSEANASLAPRDQIFVFDRESGRDRIIEPLMKELRVQSRIGEPTPEVSVAGKIKIPGKYPLEPGMRVSDLLRAGGSLDEAAYGGHAELTRYRIGDSGVRHAELIDIDLSKVLAGDGSQDLALRPFDYLVIKEVPLWTAQEEVELSGEVRFPGRYPIHRGETLRSVMERAGGLTDLAFVQGAIFTREELKEREKKQLATLATRMESDLAQASLMAAQEAGRDATQALAVGQSLLASLRDAKAVGRLVINLDGAVNAREGSEADIVLKDGDRLLVPRVTQEVTVIGEVQSTTSHLYRRDHSRNDYIALSGGLTPRAAKDLVYVVRADGSVLTRSGTSWFSRGGVEIHPGDTIVAPLDTERMRPLPFWMAVTTIIYNLSIAAAAVNSF